MTNYNAKLINERLGYNLFNESNVKNLELNKFTKKQIKEMMIEDLIDPVTKKGTDRLGRFIREILFKKKESV